MPDIRVIAKGQENRHGKIGVLKGHPVEYKPWAMAIAVGRQSDRPCSERQTVSELPTINRFAVILQPTEKYLEWAKSCPNADPRLTLDELRSEATAYLIPDTDSEQDKYLKRHFKPMLYQELFAWCMEESFWPTDLSFRTFQDFFDVQVASIVFDLANGPVVKDDADE
jgi:hypothetical protein